RDFARRIELWKERTNGVKAGAASRDPDQYPGIGNRGLGQRGPGRSSGLGFGIGEEFIEISKEGK
ncbi:hypothetical protein BpHYR1_034980, partial [Brachionus plicatilis]